MSRNSELGVVAASGIPKYRPQQVEKGAPCSAGCASGGDVREWIGIVAQRERTGVGQAQAFESAWRTITDVNPFPSVLGRICPHPCESSCNRAEHDGGVAINALERFLGDWAIEHGLGLQIMDATRQPESIGVIGAGPSGLSFAYQMARRGYSVTVYERRPMAGGMLRYGVPDYRLPPHVLTAEIDRIRSIGVVIHTDFVIGVDATIDDLRAKHDILYLGIGAQRPLSLGIQGEEGSGVFTGTDFLGELNRGADVGLGSKVVVVGGGNTAIDAARVSRRLGADVTLVYRRTCLEMPAIQDEVDAAIAEGVDLEMLASPVEIIRSGDVVVGVVIERMSLGDPGADGRRRPIPIPGSRTTLAADTVIAAISQQPDWTALETIGPEAGWVETNRIGQIDETLWAGGDVLGLSTAASAIAHGRRVAEQVDSKLRETDAPTRITRELVEADRVNFDFKRTRSPVQPLSLGVGAALRDPSTEMTSTLSEIEFLAEVERCLSCGRCMGCRQCWMYCTAMSFTKLVDVEPGRYFSLSLAACEACGKCIEVCPTGYLEPIQSL